MSEKRFILCADMNWWEVKDNGTGKTICSEEVVGLLNKLHQENQELKSKVERMEDVFKFEKKDKYQCFAELKQLRKENVQLRHELKEKQEEEHLYANEIVKLNKEVKDNQFLKLGNDY